MDLDGAAALSQHSAVSAMKNFLLRLHERWLRRPLRPLRVRSMATSQQREYDMVDRRSSPAATLVVPALNLSEVRLAVEESMDPVPESPPLMQRHDSADPAFAAPSLQQRHSAPAGVSRVRQRRHAVIELPEGLFHEPLSTARRSVVQDLPARMLSARSAANLAGEQCAICLCDYQANEDVACMPCDGLHKAHARCLRSWLELQPTCPVCRWSVETTCSGPRLSDRIERAESSLARLRADE